MATSYTIHLGTIGGGLATTRDRGQTWHLDALPADCNVRTLASYAGNSQRLLAGTDSGLFRSEDNGRTFAELETPIGDREIWSLAVDPNDPETLFVGSQPEAFRSKDGGKNWDMLSLPVNNPCPVGVPRITNIIVDLDGLHFRLRAPIATEQEGTEMKADRLILPGRHDVSPEQVSYWESRGIEVEFDDSKPTRNWGGIILVGLLLTLGLWHVASQIYKDKKGIGAPRRRLKELEKEFRDGRISLEDYEKAREAIWAEM